jgi:hypothetical protein
MENDLLPKSLNYMVSSTDYDSKMDYPFQIIKYRELMNIKNLLTLLKEPQSILIILIETAPNSGHWVSLTRFNNTFTYMDSYGLTADQELKFVPEQERAVLHENKPLLQPLLNKLEAKGFKVFQNKTDFQQFASNINTCGKWSTVASNAFASGISLAQFTKELQSARKRTGLSFDQIVNQIYIEM